MSADLLTCSTGLQFVLKEQGGADFRFQNCPTRKLRTPVTTGLKSCVPTPSRHGARVSWFRLVDLLQLYCALRDHTLPWPNRTQPCYTVASRYHLTLNCANALLNSTELHHCFALLNCAIPMPRGERRDHTFASRSVSIPYHSWAEPNFTPPSHNFTEPHHCGTSRRLTSPFAVRHLTLPMPDPTTPPHCCERRH